MSLTFRGKLLLAHLALALTVVTMVLALLERTLANDMRAVVERRLSVQADGASRWLAQNRHPEHLAPRLAAVVDARVTILDSRGAVLADSHPERAEDVNVASAEAAAAGGATRVRLTASLADVDVAIGDMRRRLAIGAVLGLAVAAALAVVASRTVARPVQGMIVAAERLARGDYAIEVAGSADDELGALARSLEALARQLERDMAQIQKLERVRRDFVANVSHELRTPVTAIQGFAETLLEGGVQPHEARRFLEGIERQAQRLSALVSALLRLASLEARGPDDAIREDVDVAALAEHVAQSAEARPDAAGKTIVLRMAKTLVAHGDPMAVEQVLDNLVENAIRHGGATVTVEGRREGAQVVVCVSDDGPGIPEEAVGRIFERFYRVQGTRAKGTGLGLAIARHLCEAMGGSIGATSRPGATTFTVTLPAAK